MQLASEHCGGDDGANEQLAGIMSHQMGKRAVVAGEPGRDRRLIDEAAGGEAVEGGGRLHARCPLGWLDGAEGDTDDAEQRQYLFGHAAGEKRSDRAGAAARLAEFIRERPFDSAQIGGSIVQRPDRQLLLARGE